MFKAVLSTHIVAVALLGLTLGGCSSNEPTTSPSNEPTATHTSSDTAGSPAGETVHVEDADSSYDVQGLTGIQAADQVTIESSSETRAAPAGQEYVTVTITITNPGSSPEPLPIEAACCNSRFQFGSAEDPSADPCPLTLAKGICWIVAEYATVEPSHADELTPELAPGETVTLGLTTLDPVPTSTDLSGLTLYYTHPIEGTIDPITLPAT